MKKEMRKREMPRYIDVEKIGYCCNPECEGKCDKCRKDDRIVSEESIEQIPTADVQEVRHGNWIEETEQIKSIAMMYTMVKFYRCSECGRKEHNKEPYCNCGAKMDGDHK